MKARLHLILAVKLAAFVGAGFWLAAQPQLPTALGAAGEGKKKAETKATGSEEEAGVPALPDEGRLDAVRASELREQLLLLRQDVLAKIETLKTGKSAFDAARKDVEGKLQKVREERQFLEDTLQKEKKAREERLGDALEFVSKMDPRKAAPVIAGMDRDLALLLMQKLPKKMVGNVLAALDAKKAAELMEYYTRIRSAREYEMLKELGLCKTADGGADTGGDRAGSADPVGTLTPAPAAAPAASSAQAAAPAQAAAGDAKP